MLDIVLAVIFVGAAIAGFQKGFLKSLIGLFGNIIALIVSYRLSSPVATVLNAKFDIVIMITQKLRDILPIPEDFSSVMASFEGMGQLYTYLDNSFLPDSVKENILATVQQQINALEIGMYATMGDIICNTIATILLQALTFLGLWLICCLILFFISHVFSNIVHMLPVVGLIDRIGGMLISLLLVFVTTVALYKGFCVLGLLENSIFAQSYLLQFCSIVLKIIGWQ